MKKCRLALVLPLLLGLAAVGCSQTQDMFAPVEAPEVNNKFEPEELWSVSAGGVGDFFSELSPAAAGGMIFAAGRDGDVYAYQASDGSRIWHTDLDDEDENDGRRSARLAGGIGAQGSRIAVGSENGWIYVLNSADGKLAWKHFNEGEIISRPVFSGSGTALFVHDARGRIAAYNAANGKVLWTTGDAPNALRLRAQSDPVAVGDEFLIIGQADGKVSVLSQSSGATVNQITVSNVEGVNDLQRVSDVASTPLLIGDTLYAAAYNGGLVRFSFKDDRVSANLGYDSSSNMAYDDDSIIIVGNNGHVYCLNRSDNSERWVQSSLTYREVSAPVIYGNYAVVGDLDGYLYFINLQNGAIDSRYELDNSGVYAAPLVSDGKLYAVSRDGHLECLKYDPAGLALAKERELNAQALVTGTGLNLMRPGISEAGIYAPDDMDYAALQQRRAAILQAARAAEARQRAYEQQRRAYEQQRREYLKRYAEYQKALAERKRQLSSFGIAPGVASQAEEEPQRKPEKPAAAPAKPQAADANEKASGFGI